MLALWRARGELDVDALWRDIKRVCGRTTEAMARRVTTAATAAQLWPHELSSGDRDHCFHILGLDVILDEKAKPFLLEVNSNASLGIDSVWPTEGSAAAPPPSVPPHAPLRPAHCSAHS